MARRPPARATSTDAPDGVAVWRDGLPTSSVRVRALRDGFRRGGRAWRAVAETLAPDALTPAQWAAVLAEPLLVVTPRAMSPEQWAAVQADPAAVVPPGKR